MRIEGTPDTDPEAAYEALEAKFADKSARKRLVGESKSRAAASSPSWGRSAAASAGSA